MAARKVIVAGGLGPLAGWVCRIGHMGNIGSSEVRCTLTAVAESLSALGRSVDPRDASEAALRHLEAV
jgi:aspartate aminotransferase-like enzyme